ncbi:EspF repeat-containing protein [uncultured Rothia sp.]|uniref:EspF repeat-containing protein n=1 Tax=uncultured Rothia sp. TaxID=316088 RepID=UPI0037DCCE9F
MPARRTVPQHPRCRYLPAHHLGLQLRRAHGARHVAEHRPPAPNRPKTSRPVGATACRAREHLQRWHTNRRTLDAYAHRSAPRSATGTPAGTFYPRSATASR